MVTALMNSKNPALVLGAPWGGAVGTNPSLGREEPVPMAVSVAGGVVRPHLTVVGEKSGPGIEVHEITVAQLTASLNVVRGEQLAENGEATALTLMLALASETAYEQGLADGQRSLVGVSS